jgi:hypothetical protein
MSTSTVQLSALFGKEALAMMHSLKRGESKHGAERKTVRRQEGTSERWAPFGPSLQSLVVSDSDVTGVQVALSLFVLLGFSGLAIDLGRTLIAQTELQQAADGAALAAAAELDGYVAVQNGPSDAITRATAAATDFVNNGQTFANTGSGAITLQQIAFLSGSDCGTPLCYPTPTRILPPSLPNDSLTTRSN